MLLQKSQQLLHRHAVHTGTPFIGLKSFQWLLIVFPLADIFHQRFGNGRVFSPALLRSRSWQVFLAAPLLRPQLCFDSIGCSIAAF